MAPSNKFIISDKAYLKVALHAAKHPHAVVNGVLVGKQQGQNAGTKVWNISDAIPLLHHWTNLSPMMEVGLQLAEIHAKKNGLAIIGFYHSSERIEDTDTSPVAQHILEQLTKTQPSAFAFLVDANRIPLGQPLLKIHMVLQRSSQLNDSQPADVFDLENDESPARALSAIRERQLQAQLQDFDDHLENVGADWLSNSAISSST